MFTLWRISHIRIFSASSWSFCE